ncbi:MAG: ABC transporter permease [Vicinamibacterales bacterium]
MNDLAYSARLLRRHPRYTLLAVLTLAVGIGVTTAMFGLLDAMFFRPLPLAEPDRLVELSLQSPGSRFGTVSYQEFLDIERNAPALQDVFAIGRRGVTFNHNGDTQSLLIHYVSGRYFPSLGIPMHLGRGLAEGDDRPEATTPHVVINHHLWQERLGAPADIIGRPIQLNNTIFTVVGVTARGFAGLHRMQRTDFWVTTQQSPFVVPGFRDDLANRSERWFRVMGRLADGATIEQARAGLDVLAARWREAGAREYQDASLVIRSRAEDTRKQTTNGAVLLGLIGLILLIACANVANLTLARGEGRRREIGVRAALGATRPGLLRQLLLESAVVSVAGGLAGLLLASWVVRMIPALLPPGAESMVLDVRVDGRLLIFALLLSTLTMLLVGIAPAWKGSRADITTALKGDARIPVWRGGRVQLRDVLVVAEIALSGIVIIAASLLLRSFAQTLAIAPGFDTTKNVSTFYMVPGIKGYDRPSTYRLLEEARRGAAALPGVTRASYGIRVPAQGNEAGWSAFFTIPGKEPPPGTDAFELRYTMVGPDYFELMGTRILHGRGIVEADQPASLPVAVISESMARQLWPGESPLGRRIRMGRQAPVDREIVGVAEDIRIGSLYEAPEMYVYVPFAQHPQGFGLLFVESAIDASALVPSVRQQIASLAPGVPVLNVSSFAAHMDLLLYEERRNAWIGLIAAVLALTLGAVGVYSVVSLTAARRTRELGIRAALGAGRAQLVRLLLGRGAVLAAAGSVLGIAGGVAAGHLLERQLHGVRAADPWSLVIATAGLGLVAATANLVPAWRASHVDPVAALKGD